MFRCSHRSPVVKERLVLVALVHSLIRVVLVNLVETSLQRLLELGWCGWDLGGWARRGLRKVEDLGRHGRRGGESEHAWSSMNRRGAPVCRGEHREASPEARVRHFQIVACGVGAV